MDAAKGDDVRNSIGYNAFGGCSELASITLGNSVTTIGSWAFFGCVGLTDVIIPASVSNLEEYAFCYCYMLTNVTFMGDAPMVGSSSFDSVYRCVASVSPRSTGWSVGVGEKWNGLTLQYWPEVLTEDVSNAEVYEIVATFADKALSEQIATVSEYDAFRSWIGNNNLYQPAVVANTNAAAAYLLGAGRLFENAPKIEFEEVSVADGEDGGLGTSRPTMTLSVTVKDGDEAVKCAAEKVKSLFKATSDLGDWDGAAKLEPEVSIEATDDPTTMRFKVTPSDGTATRAFIRIQK